MILQEQPDDILPDVVHIPLDCTEDDRSSRHRLLISEIGFQHTERFLHRLRSHDHLREIDLLPVVLLSDFLNCRNEELLVDMQSRLSRSQRFLNERADLVPVSRKHSLRDHPILFQVKLTFIGFFFLLLLDVTFHKLPRILIPHRQDRSGLNCFHHSDIAGIHDGCIQPGSHGHAKERRVDEASFGKAVGDIRDAQNSGQTQFFLYHAYGFECRLYPFLLGRYSQRQTIAYQIMP